MSDLYSLLRGAAQVQPVLRSMVEASPHAVQAPKRRFV